MSTILSTIEGYEDQVIDLVNKAQEPVVEYVNKTVELVNKAQEPIVEYVNKTVELVNKAQAPVVEYVNKTVAVVGDHLPDVDYPANLPTPAEVIESQTAFAKKLIDADMALVSAVRDTLAGQPKSATKATKPVKAVKAA